MHVEMYTDKLSRQWDQFVRDNSDCWHYHQIGWKTIVEQSYGHQCKNLVAIEDGKIIGLLPLVMIRSRLFGSSLTSLPFVDYAGLITENAEARKAIVEKSVQIAKANDIDYIELRQLRPIEGELIDNTHKATLVIDLAKSEDDMFSSLSSERRNRIRKAKKAGLSVEILGHEALPAFYKIWTENMRDLGSPAHSYSFFESILRVFPDSANVIMVKYEGQYIGAAISLYYGNKLALPWVSSLRKTFSLYPNNLLYWDTMLYAIKKGCRYFDFGRSTIDSGTYTFKVRWGATASPLHWQIIELKKYANFGYDNQSAKFKLAMAMWKKMPVSCSRIIGPIIRKKITA